MTLVKAGAYVLPLVVGLAMCALEIADWTLWVATSRNVAPLFWRGLDWLLFPFALAGLPLLAPTAWIWSGLSPALSRLFGPLAVHNCIFFLIFPCLLLSLYLVVRGRLIPSKDIMRASCAGSGVLFLIGVISTLLVKGSGDGQAAISLVMGQNGGLVAGALAAELILRHSGGRTAL